MKPRIFFEEQPLGLIQLNEIFGSIHLSIKSLKIDSSNE